MDIARPGLIVIDRLAETIKPGKAAAPNGPPPARPGPQDQMGSYFSLATEYAEPKDRDSVVSLSSGMIPCGEPRDGGGLTGPNRRVWLEGITEACGALGPHRPVPDGMSPPDLFDFT